MFCYYLLVIKLYKSTIAFVDFVFLMKLVILLLYYRV